jgi:hypothetical protein
MDLRRCRLHGHAYSLHGTLMEKYMGDTLVDRIYANIGVRPRIAAWRMKKANPISELVPIDDYRGNACETIATRRSARQGRRNSHFRPTFKIITGGRQH